MVDQDIKGDVITTALTLPIASMCIFFYLGVKPIASTHNLMY